MCGCEGHISTEETRVAGSPRNWALRDVLWLRGSRAGWWWGSYICPGETPATLPQKVTVLVVQVEID